MLVKRRKKPSNNHAQRVVRVVSIAIFVGFLLIHYSRWSRDIHVQTATKSEEDSRAAPASHEQLSLMGMFASGAEEMKLVARERSKVQSRRSPFRTESEVERDTRVEAWRKAGDALRERLRESSVRLDSEIAKRIPGTSLFVRSAHVLYDPEDKNGAIAVVASCMITPIVADTSRRTPRDHVSHFLAGEGIVNSLPESAMPPSVNEMLTRGCAIVRSPPPTSASSSASRRVACTKCGMHGASPKIVCETSSSSLSSLLGAGEEEKGEGSEGRPTNGGTPSLQLVLGQDEISIPIEATAEQTWREADARIHVCVEGMLWNEKTNGKMPDEFLETFIKHYARLGISNIHFYTKALEMAEMFERVNGGARLPSFAPDGTRLTVQVHDTGLPPWGVDIALLTVRFMKFQFFAMDDCLLRAKSAGAAWALVIDLDEYLFPSLEDRESVEGVRRRGIVHALEKLPPLVDFAWIPSFLFSTVTCAPHPKTGGLPSGHRDFLSHFAYAKFDKMTKWGRRKLLVRLGRLRPLELATLAVFVHSLFVPGSRRASEASPTLAPVTALPAPPTSRQPRMSYIPPTASPVSPRELHRDSNKWLHIHHYRDGWHRRVCTRVGRGQDDGEGFNLHRPAHEEELRLISTDRR